MSQDDLNFLNDDLDVSSSENEEEKIKAGQIEKTVESLTKWVSALEDKVADCTEAVKVSLDNQDETHKTLVKISSALDQLVKVQVRTERKRTRLRIANYELATALSDKLYKSEAKRNKTGCVQRGTIHPTVLPFIVSEDEE